MVSLPRLHLTLLKPEDVIPHLGSPTHWKQGRSAKALSDRWFQAKGDIPGPVKAALNQAPELRGAELIDAWLERCTDLQDGRVSASQTDLLAIIGLSGGIGVLGIEAKVTETFGDRVADWLGDGSEGKKSRLAKLCVLFGVAPDEIGDLRYQLLHRTAAAVIEARRYRARTAAMLVQSFCPNATGFRDFATFCERLGFGPLEVGGITKARQVDGVSLRLGWVADEAPPEDTKSKTNLDPPSLELPLILSAAAFAADKHRMQRRKDHEASPYINHPLGLARILACEAGIDDPVTIAAALLHDTVEDTETTIEELQERFGEEVAAIVAEVTDDKSLPKAERKRLQVAKAASRSDRAKLVKLADKTSNLRDIAATPPADWSLDRRRQYLEWAREVVAGLRGVCPPLEQAFDEAYEEGATVLRQTTETP